MNEIETLIPHRDPFLFVDEIETANENEIIGHKHYDESFEYFKGHFPHLKIVPGMILVESMAQCGGAGVRKLRKSEDGIFVLASIESAQFLNAVEIGKTVRMKIKNIRLGSKVIKQQGTAYVDDKPVAEATWMCART